MSGINIPNLIAQNICWGTLFAGLLPKYKRFAVLWRHSCGCRLRSVCGRVCLIVCFSLVFWFVLFICLWPANLLICLRPGYLTVDFALNYRLSSIYNCSGAACVARHGYWQLYLMPFISQSVGLASESLFISCQKVHWLRNVATLSIMLLMIHEEDNDKKKTNSNMRVNRYESSWLA